MGSGNGKNALHHMCGGRVDLGRRFKSGRTLLTSAAILALSISAASAQQAQTETAADAATDEAAPVVLDQITVVSRTGETAIDTLASVSQVGPEQLERRMASTPGDLLFGIPGVATQSDTKRAISSINIRGLQDFGRVAVIVDGARQNFQRSGHGTQSVFFIDPELVKQVDVIRGPVANTYGSGAIGGVVAFETKDAKDFLNPGETYAASVTGRYETNGSGYTTSATGAYRFNEVADVIGNIVWRDFGDYKDGDGDRVAGTGFDVLSGMLKTTIRPTENSKLRLGWVGASDSWKESIDTYDADLKQNTFTARYELADPENPWVDLHINVSYNKADLTQTRLKPGMQFDSVTGIPTLVPAGSETNYGLDTYGIDIWNTSRFDTGVFSHELTYGGDWLKDDVVTTSPTGGSDVYTPSGRRTVWGAYVQNKASYADWLEIIGGLRYDSYKLAGDADSSGDRLSPRITVGVSPFEKTELNGLQFYGTYAEGYRSPSVTETLISGLHPNGVAFPFLPNPNLKPETAKTVEFGVNYKRDGLFYADDGLRLKAAYFNNDISDYIGGRTLSPFVPGSGCPFVPGTIPICYQYQNFAEAKINGVELEAIYDAGRFFGGLSVSVIDGHTYSEGVREDLLTVPSSQVTAHLGFRMLDERLTIGGEVQYNGAPDGNASAENYTLVNAFVNYKVNDNFKVDFRADNIFDKKYANPLNATTTSTVYEPGVTLKLAATMRFGG